MQNLPQNKMPERDLDTARQLVRAGDLETLEMLYDDISGTLSQLIRTAFIPKKGHRLIVADFSAIEARVIAWLAGEQWRLDVFQYARQNLRGERRADVSLAAWVRQEGRPYAAKGKNRRACPGVWRKHRRAYLDGCVGDGLERGGA